MRSKRYWLTDDKDDKDNILLNGKDMMQAIILGNQPETSSISRRVQKMTKSMNSSLSTSSFSTPIVGKVAAQDVGLSEGEDTHEVGVESLQGAVAQQEG